MAVVAFGENVRLKQSNAESFGMQGNPVEDLRYFFVYKMSVDFLSVVM